MYRCPWINIMMANYHPELIELGVVHFIIDQLTVDQLAVSHRTSVTPSIAGSLEWNRYYF